jgi:histone H3/H4
MDNAVRRVAKQSNPNLVFEEGTDVLLRLGCLLFLEKVAKETHETARAEGRKLEVSSEDVKRAATAVLSEVRQFN